MPQGFQRVYEGVNDVGLNDAVPVVRCKDCKNFFDYGKTSLNVDGKNTKAGWCMRRARFCEELRMLPDDFCSYGERKDGK